MSYPAEHRHLTKPKIVRSARRLFNRHGFDAVSIDDVMADAGLTRGSFCRNYLAHASGDAVNAVLAAAGYNFRRLLGLRLLLLRILIAFSLPAQPKSV